MGIYTTHYNLFLPSIGEQGWGDLINGNFSIIDTTMKGLDTRVGTLEAETATLDGRATASEDKIAVLEDDSGYIYVDVSTTENCTIADYTVTFDQASYSSERINQVLYNSSGSCGPFTVTDIVTNVKRGFKVDNLPIMVTVNVSLYSYAGANKYASVYLNGELVKSFATGNVNETSSYSVDVEVKTGDVFTMTTSASSSGYITWSYGISFGNLSKKFYLA